MKVILSPSKEQRYDAEAIDDMKMLPFLKKTKELVTEIQTLSAENLSEMMHIKGDLLKSVYDTYQNFGHTGILPAIQAYNGIAFRQIPVESYTNQALRYLEENVRILSAMYGILTPLTGISAYRLDMKMKLKSGTLYAYWKEELSRPFAEEELIINLASTEFSKLIKMPMVTVAFKEYRQGRLKTIGTNAKKARGQMVHFMAMNQIDTLEALSGFDVEGWRYERQFSDEKTMIFVRGHADEKA